MAAGNTADYRAATYMVLVRLATVCSLQAKVLNTLLIGVAKGGCSKRPAAAGRADGLGGGTDSSARAGDALACIVALCEQQHALDRLPEKCLKHLARYTDLCELIGDVAREHDARRFLSLFGRRLVDQSVKHAAFIPLAMEYVRSVDLPQVLLEMMVAPVLARCVEQHIEEAEDEAADGADGADGGGGKKKGKANHRRSRKPRD